MIGAIVAAEVAFWVLLVGGLLLRYVVRAPRLSAVALAAVPLVDLGLVVLVAVDIARGAPADRAHGIAAIYLGFTIAFGHALIRRTDQWFRFRFAGGTRPPGPTKGSPEEVRALWIEWARVVLAAVIACACLLLLIALDGRGVPADLDAAAADPYWSLMLLLALITTIWFIAGPLTARRSTPAVERTGGVR